MRNGIRNTNIRKCGYIKSKLDGTEHIWNTKMDKLPEEYSYISVMPEVLDQGDTYKCVCYSLTSYLDWKVNRLQGDNISDNFDIDKLYSIRTRKDLNGMTIKEALHYLRHTGLNGVKISGYAKINSIEHLKSALISNGPCITGLYIRDPKRDDFWHGDQKLGGHAILIIGYNEKGFIIRNSWGKGWADKGYTVVPYSDFKKFLEIWTMF